MREALRVCVGIAASVFLVGCSGGDQAGTQHTAADPAMMGSARIFPNPAYSNSVLEVGFKTEVAVDPNDYNFTWKRNGEVIEGTGGNTLDDQYFTRGDRVSVDISPVDPASADDRSGIAWVNVQNSPPRVLSASTMMAMRERPEIFVHIGCNDIDGDPISYRYRWFVDGEILAGQTDDVLDPSLVKRGQQVYAEIVVSDGQSYSTPFKSDPITVENHAPRVVSIPNAISPNEDRFEYQITVADSDADEFTYELLSAPEGMIIDATGLVTWTYPPREQRTGSFKVEIRVSDAMGGSIVQEFSLSFADNSK